MAIDTIINPSTPLDTSFKPNVGLMPAQLWIGKEDQLITLVYDFLQSHFCKKQKCQTCIICTNIIKQQHHSILWIAPEKQYTLELLEGIKHTIAFARSADDPFFFILQRADWLRVAGANSLLKTLEEPPIGYHFILLAGCLEDVIPTIRSRCSITIYQQLTTTTTYKDIFTFFVDVKSYDPQAFIQIIEKSLIHEYDSRLLLDALMQHWACAYKSALEENNTKKMTQAQRVMRLLKKNALQPPMSGSAKLFWKNFFLQFQALNRP